MGSKTLIMNILLRKELIRICRKEVRKLYSEYHCMIGVKKQDCVLEEESLMKYRNMRNRALFFLHRLWECELKYVFGQITYLANRPRILELLELDGERIVDKYRDDLAAPIIDENNLPLVKPRRGVDRIHI